MRIGVDCHVLSGKYQGSRTYIENLYSAVLRKAGAGDFVFLVDRADAQPFGSGAQHAAYASRNRFHRLTLGTQNLVNRQGLDAVHVGYIAPLRMKALSVVTLYDILFETHPQFFAWPFVLRSRLLCRLSASRAGQIHTISDYSRSVITQRYGVPEERIAVVPCGVDTNRFHPHDRSAAQQAVFTITGTSRYILTVGRLEPRKNHVGLICAYARLRQRVPDCPALIIVGQPDFREQPIYGAIKTHGLEGTVRVLQDIDDDLLPTLYRGAELFVYPSFAEGFGLPPLEAMASGAPVITSDTTAMPEVVGKAAVLIDPESAESICEGMERVLLHPQTARELSSLGRKHAMKWTWDAAAEKYLEAIEALERTQRTLRSNPLRHSKTIAFCGTRGVPANYGGFETAVDQISRRFVNSGYDCEVICRRSSSTGVSKPPAEHEGRRLIYVDGHRSRTLDTFVAAIQTGRHLWRNRHRYHHVFWFNNANLPGILLTALAGIPMSVNTDGLEWRRSKWAWPFKLYYWLASFLIARFSRHLISDSRGIQDYYRRRFIKTTSFIPYGAPRQLVVANDRAREILRDYGLESGRYFLQITRIEPDNLPVKVAEAFVRSNLVRLGYRMVFVGYREDTPYARRLVAFDGRGGVRVHEAQYDPEVLQALRRHCYCYVHGNSVGGTNPALLEAMAACPRVIAIDCEFSREVLGGLGRYFDPKDLAPTLNEALAMRDQSDEMRRRVAERYDWEAVASAYMNLAEGRPADYRPGPDSEEISQRDGKMVPRQELPVEAGV